MTAPADRPPPEPLNPNTTAEQLRRWVLGDPVHRDRDAPDGGECCPDFSCCRPELLAPPEVRLAFANASEGERFGLLMSFLGGGVKAAVGEGDGADPPPVIVWRPPGPPLRR